MIKQIKLFTVFIATCMLTSCSSSVNINDYIDKSSPFNLTLNSTDTTTGLTKSTQTYIAVNSDQYSKLINWFNNNQSGWQWTPASYVAKVSVGQGSFRLLYTTGTGGVVISFIDKENKERQYSKTIKKGELDFLTNK